MATLYDDPLRCSNWMFGLAAGSGLLSYLHGLCGAILQEPQHRGYSSWLSGVATGLWFLVIMLVVSGAMVRSAERHFAAACAEQETQRAAALPPPIAATVVLESNTLRI